MTRKEKIKELIDDINHLEYLNKGGLGDMDLFGKICDGIEEFGMPWDIAKSMAWDFAIDANLAFDFDDTYVFDLLREYLEKYDEVDMFNSMMESCFTYGGVRKATRNYIDYLKKYESKLGKFFEPLYRLKYFDLHTNYKVLKNTSTDHEGCTYNSLVKK